MLEDYFKIRAVDDSSTQIPPLVTHNLISNNIFSLGGLDINSISTSNDHLYDSLIKCNYINDVSIPYMDSPRKLGTYRREPVKAYTGHPEFYGGLLSNVTCYFDKVTNKYDYILDVYSTSDRYFTHNVIPDNTFSVVKTDNMIDYFEVMVDSYNTGTTVIYKIDSDIYIKKYINGELYRDFVLNFNSLTIKKYDKTSDTVFYHCSAVSSNNFVIIVKIGAEFRYDIIDLDSRITNLSMVKISNGMSTSDNGFVSIDTSKIYRLSSKCEITRVINYTEYSTGITDYNSLTEIYTNDKLSEVWVKTASRLYYIKEFEYQLIPNTTLQKKALETDMKKPKDKLHYLLGYDSSTNPIVDYFAYGPKAASYLKCSNNGGVSKKNWFFSPIAEVKSSTLFNASTVTMYIVSKNMRPFHYRYSMIVQHKSVPNYTDLLRNINKMSRNVEYGTRMTTTNVDYLTGSSTVPLITYGKTTTTPLFKFSTLKTLYINNCKLK